MKRMFPGGRSAMASCSCDGPVPAPTLANCFFIVAKLLMFRATRGIESLHQVNPLSETQRPEASCVLKRYSAKRRLLLTTAAWSCHCTPAHSATLEPTVPAIDP